MSNTEAHNILAPLQTETGGFAMLAVDQREALRNMMAEQRHEAISDQDVTQFKLDAARILTPNASAVLIDRQFALRQALDQNVVDDRCGIIASADHFESAHGELVGEVSIDRLVDPYALREEGVVALKLLVLYRPDGGASQRIDMTTEFVELCSDAGVASIIEPVSRKPLDDREWDWNEGVIAAANELGALGADLYKAEVPHRGTAEEGLIRADCRALDEAISGPWVVLSSGVPEATFPEAVRLACLEGASGFLAGRAVWASCLAEQNVNASLATDGVRRLNVLRSVVDANVGVRIR